MKKIIYTLLFILAVSAPACAQAEQEERPFTIAIDTTDIELHPHRSFTVTEAQVFTAIYEGLVSYDPRTLVPEAAVAERWEISEDGLTYTFYLRKDARYWNGDQVTADHFYDAWLHLLSSEGAYFSILFDVIEGATDYRNGVTESREEVGITVIDSHTLQIQLSAPAPFFLSTLCHYSFSPIHPRMQRVEEWGEFPLLLTNGPYILKSRTDDEIILEQNGRYWDHDSDNFQQMRYIYTDDSEEIFNDFAAREIDWVMSGFGEMITRYSDDLQVNPILGTNFYFFITDQSPWDDADIRRALALLVDWNEVRSPTYYTFPSAALVPPIPGYPEQEGIQEANREEALRLLAERGYVEGVGLPSLTIAVPDSEEDRRVAEILQQSWRQELNLDVILNFVPGDEYLDYVALESEYTIGRISWIGDYVDPLAFLQLWSSDSNLNHARYDNAEYDALLLQSAEIETRDERFALLAEAEKLIVDGALVLPVNHSVAVNAIDTEQITGWYTNILDIHPVKHIEYRRTFLLPNIALRK